MNSGIGGVLSHSNALRSERLFVDADRLFSIGWLIKRLLNELQHMLTPEAAQAPHMFFYSLRQEAVRWFAWQMLGAHQKSIAEVKALQQMFPEKQMFLDKLKEEREAMIREFSRILISKRWDLVKDDDRSWREFARVVFNTEKTTPGVTREFFPLLDYISVITDIICGRANLYFLDTTEADLAELRTYMHENTEADLESIAPRAELKSLLKGPWFDKYSADKDQYTIEWREKFVDDLLKTEYGRKMIAEWDKRSSVIKGNVVGCLQEAGVFLPEVSALKIARTILYPFALKKSDNAEEEKEKMKKSKTLHHYITHGNKEKYYYWVMEYVGKFD